MTVLYKTRGESNRHWGSTTDPLIHGILTSVGDDKAVLRSGHVPPVSQPPLFTIVVTTDVKSAVESSGFSGIEFNQMKLILLDENIEWDSWDPTDPRSIEHIDTEQHWVDSWMLNEHKEGRSNEYETPAIWSTNSKTKIDVVGLETGEVSSPDGFIQIRETKLCYESSQYDQSDFMISNDHFPTPVVSERFRDLVINLGGRYIDFTPVYPA